MDQDCYFSGFCRLLIVANEKFSSTGAGPATGAGPGRQRSEPRGVPIIIGDNIKGRDEICPNLFTVTGGIFSGYDESNLNNTQINLSTYT